MDNYSLPFVKCHCACYGKSFTCIKAVWFCKECSEKMWKNKTK